MIGSDRQWKLFLAGTFIVFVSTIPVTYSQFGTVGLESISIIVTSLLTLALVGLYREQHLVLKQQQEPQLEVSNVDLSNNLNPITVDISNFGGGAATSMHLRIDLHELKGDGPIRQPGGILHRINIDANESDEKTRSSAIRPSELNVPFETESRGVLSTNPSRDQESLASIVGKALDEDRNVIYGKIVVEYATKFDVENEYEAEFSLKFTKPDEIEYEAKPFLPWNDENVQRWFGE